MIKVIVVKIVIKNNWLLKINDWITNHLGIKPKNGGNPPNESKFINRENFKIFELKNKENNWLIWNKEKILNKKIRLNDKKV